MALDIFKDDVKNIKIRKNDYQTKVDEVLDKKNIKEEDITLTSLNLLEMEEDKKIKKSAMTIYLEEEDLEILKAVSIMKKTTVSKTINTLIKATVSTTKSNLPSDFNLKQYVDKYDVENKLNKNKK
jgi:hypothetical protein